MANPVAPWGNAQFDGFAKVTEIGPLGMISLRAKRDVVGLKKAFSALGLTLPDTRRIVIAGDKAAGWMSPAVPEPSGLPSTRLTPRPAQ
jgi:sarcosine oxidase subunit gamma